MNPKYEEIDIDLSKHDVDITSKADGKIFVKIDGREVHRIKQVRLNTEFIKVPQDMHKKTLKMILHHPECN